MAISINACSIINKYNDDDDNDAKFFSGHFQVQTG